MDLICTPVMLRRRQYEHIKIQTHIHQPGLQHQVDRSKCRPRVPGDRFSHQLPPRSCAPHVSNTLAQVFCVKVKAHDGVHARSYPRLPLFASSYNAAHAFSWFSWQEYIAAVYDLNVAYPDVPVLQTAADVVGAGTATARSQYYGSANNRSLWLGGMFDYRGLSDYKPIEDKVRG